MKSTLSTLLFILIGSTLSLAQSKITVDSVFNKYYDATGGKALWDNIKTYSMQRSYRAGTSADYDAEVYVSLPEQAMHKSKIIMKRGFVYAVKGNDGWLKIPLGSGDKVTKYQVNDLGKAEQTSMRAEMYDLLVPFLNYQTRGYVATLVGTETLNGKPVHQVELQSKDVRYNLYFDAGSGLLVREKQLEGGVETVTDYSNYTKSKYGIMYPAAAVETNTKDKKAIKVTTASLAINEAINPEYFKR
ncbi:hypothetical protein GCM10027275_31570 [Rhabdobacter roseus]|uniref:Putative salt-induced outer membrane protein n=1 Tax=Rhabdobacter roseus TaxID=1655419 RepID=A0A840TLM2_9BACT|nr:hypothetical protein [Rhabdobacter roseus]MBB5285116.1 putative salt-induced outer membrane protein [Rhabdobacter roseus]